MRKQMAKHNKYNIVEGENKGLYYIKETKTDLIVKTYTNWSDARKMYVHLNAKGGGFDGWTPEFFLKKVKK
jgi:hypothetical protein